MSTKPALGVALGGGTARGLAHIGALQVLEERGLPPDAVAGTSYGAIIAALYALGAPALEIEHVVRQQNTMEIWAQGLDFGLHEAALIHGRRLARWMDRKYFRGATFDDCALPLAIATTDLATGELHVLTSGSIATAVQASCALPGIFAPVPIDGRILIDGGFVEPVPFRTLEALAPQRAVGIHAGIDVGASRLIGWFRTVHRTRAGRAWLDFTDGLGTGNPWSRLLRGLGLSMRAYEHGIAVPPDTGFVQISPPVAWWDFHRSPQAIAAGRRAMERALDGVEGLADVVPIAE